MRLLRTAPVALAALCSPALAQDVPVEKYTLPNGMTVILHEDHSLPVATVNIWYRVGAQDEPPGRSGFAHLFEHLMFMGTARVPGNNFDVLMENGGGANNASTDLHRTNYYSWGPSKLLPTLLWLDADRLEDMGNTMTTEKLDKQRDIVRNELRQTVENAPYGKAAEAVYKMVYPPTHPYYYGVIGTHGDLEAADVVNVKDFFANFYVARNASLVVAGDFDKGAIKPLVDRLFGSLAPGAAVSRKYALPAEPIAVHLGGVKRFTAIDAVQLPKVQYTYHSPAAYGPGDAESRLVADVLAEGKSSRLYKRLVIDDTVAVEVSASQQSSPLGSLLQIDVLTKPEADPDSVEKALDEELARLVKDGPAPDELERAKARIELSALESLQSVERKADKLNEYEYFYGQPNSFKRDLDRFRTATPAGVREWAGKVLTPDARAIVRVVPEKPQRPPSARDARPADSPGAAFTPAPPQSFTLKNGLKVMVFTKKDLPLVALRLVCRPGGALDAPGRQGVSSLAGAMLGEGAGELGALAFEDAVKSIGAEFSSGADHESLQASMTVLKRTFDQGLGYFADAVRRPRMDATEWERVKALAVEDLRKMQDDPAAVAAVVGQRLLFGDANPYAWPSDGTISSVESLTLEEVKGARAGLLRPQACTLLIAGDVTGEEAKAALEKALGDWVVSGAAGERAGQSFAIPAHDGLRVAIVDKPGATQTVIRFVAPGVTYADSNRVKLRLLNTLLGGSFTSRLNQNLREDHGYTYGARSRFEMNPSAGGFSATARVKADVTGASLREFFKEFDRLRGGDVTDEEAVKVRETLRNDTIRPMSRLSGLLNEAATLVENNLPFTTMAADLSAMEKVGSAELNALARPAIPLEKGVLVLVGDKGVIRAQLAEVSKDLKLPAPEEVDAGGKAVVGK